MSKLQISHRAIDAVTRAGMRKYPLETGGILLGTWDSTNRVATVLHVVGAGPRALHARHSFEPDQPWQEERIARLYTQAGRRLEYLGDWHTHPGGPPRPSLRDLRVLWLIAHAPQARARRPVMLIAGLQAGAKPDFRAYRYSVGIVGHGLAVRCGIYLT